MSNVQLPAGWASATIDQILMTQSDGKIIHQGWSPQCHKEPAEEGEWGVLKTTSIQDGYFLDSKNKKLPVNKEPKPRIEVRVNDLLLTNAGPRARCGVATLVRKTRSKLMLSGKMYRMRFDERFIFPNLVEFWLRTSQIQAELNERKTGISESGLNMTQDRFLTLPVVVLPLAEQQQIVAQLNAMLAKVDNLKISLDNISAILKRFRQSVLAAAVSGRLSEEWRGRSERVGWEDKTIFDVVQAKPRNGNSPNGVEYETPYKNLTLSATTLGYFVDGKFKYVNIDISDDSYLWVKPGDVLIQRANTIEYVGVSAIYKGPANRYVYPDLMMKCTPNESILGDYLHYCLLSQKVRKYFRDNATGTAGNMPKINQQTVCSAPICVPSIKEQTEIVRRVEQLFAFADQIEQRVKDAQLRVNHLTPSILAKAFRGELTAEWREHNPDLISGENSAEALLKKIKTEREKMVSAKKNNREGVKTKAGNNMKPKQIIPITEALKVAGAPLAAQTLLVQSGYSSDATTDELERFFLDIREQLNLGSILRVRSGDEDIFTLVK